MGGRARTIGGGARTGDKPVGKGKREGYGGREGVNTEVELNRRRWKSIGRSTSNNSHATSIVATCSVARSYKISLRGWAEEEKESGRKGVKMEKRGNGERGDRDGKGKKIMNNDNGRIAVLVHRRISCKVFCNFARTLSSN